MQKTIDQQAKELEDMKQKYNEAMKKLQYQQVKKLKAVTPN